MVSAGSRGQPLPPQVRSKAVFRRRGRGGRPGPGGPSRPREDIAKGRPRAAQQRRQPGACGLCEPVAPTRRCVRCALDVHCAAGQAWQFAAVCCWGDVDDDRGRTLTRCKCIACRDNLPARRWCHTSCQPCFHQPARHALIRSLQGKGAVGHANGLGMLHTRQVPAGVCRDAACGPLPP